MTTLAPYLIAKRRAGDPAVLAQEVDSAEYTFNASAINIAMSMLSATTAKDAMSRLTLKADSSMTGVSKRYNGQMTSQVMFDVDAFLEHLKHSFPMVIIDEQMHSAVLGYHPRGEWDGNFDPCTQGILVNGNISWLLSRERQPFYPMLVFVRDFGSLI